MTLSTPDQDDFEDDYEDYDEPDVCDCEDYEADILTGVASCWRCGNRWHMSDDELRREIQFIAEYAEYTAEENER